MKCCSSLTKNQTWVGFSSFPSSAPLTSNNSTTTTLNSTTSAVNTEFQFESGFCQYCGVDTFLFSHEFWCRFFS